MTISKSAPKVALSVLGHHDPARFRRAVVSALNAVDRAENGIARAVIGIDADCGHADTLRNAVTDLEGLPEIVEFSGGSAPAGKNAILDQAKPDEWLWQLDGDDVYYPWAVASIHRDIALARDADVIVYYGFDVIAPDMEAWGAAASPDKEWPYGRGRNPHWNRKPYVTSIIPRLYSPKALHSRQLRFDDDLLVYEDALLSYQLLSLHQQGTLRTWISFGTDTWAVERSVKNGVQDNEGKGGKGYEYWTDQLFAKRLQWTYEWASNFGELPGIWPHVTVSHGDKLAALRALQEHMK